MHYHDYLVQKLKSHNPAHHPIWTALCVSKLAFPDMLVDIEVEAHWGKQ